MRCMPKRKPKMGTSSEEYDKTLGVRISARSSALSLSHYV